MKEDYLKKMSLAELKKRERFLRFAISILLGTVILLIIVGIFLTYKQGFSIYTVNPIIFTSILLINVVNLKKLRAEISSRIE